MRKFGCVAVLLLLYVAVAIVVVSRNRSSSFSSSFSSSSCSNRLVGSLQAPNACLLLCLSRSISLIFFLRQSPPNLFPLRSMLGAGYERAVDTRIIGSGSCLHSTRNHDVRLQRTEETQERMAQILVEVSEFMGAAQAPGLGTAPAAALAAPAAPPPTTGFGGPGTNAGDGLGPPPLPTTAAADDALREALARQAAARSVAEAADQRAADLLAAAGAASSSSSTPSTRYPNWRHGL